MRILFPRDDRALEVSERPPREHRFAALAANLEALASETRLELLHALRTPQSAYEIRVAPSLSREGESPDRALSRQAVSRHLEQLRQAGLVQREPARDRQRGDLYVLNHERLFAMVDEMRGLAKLRPFAARTLEAGSTLDGAGPPPEGLPAPPRLLVAYGRDDGLGFGLSEEGRASWRIGRGPPCEILLDYDPYLSTTHCIVERTTTGFRVLDKGSKNGTWVNWQRLPRGGARDLAPGDLITVGRSVLAFQA